MDASTHLLDTARMLDEKDMDNSMQKAKTTSMLRIKAFFALAIGYLENSPGCESLWKQYEEIQAAFKREIRRTTPDLLPFMRGEGVPDDFPRRLNADHVSEDGRETDIWLNDLACILTESNGDTSILRTTIMDQMQLTWPAAIERCVQASCDLILQHLLECMTQTLGQYDPSELTLKIRSWLRDEVTKEAAHCQAFIGTLVKSDYGLLPRQNHGAEVMLWTRIYEEARKVLHASSNGPASGFEMDIKAMAEMRVTAHARMQYFFDGVTLYMNGGLLARLKDELPALEASLLK